MPEGEPRKSILVSSGISLEPSVVEEIARQIGGVTIQKKFIVNHGRYGESETSLADLSSILEGPFDHGALAIYSDDEHVLETARITAIMAATLPSISIVELKGGWDRDAYKSIYSLGKIFPEIQHSEKS